jgi:superfamily II DNA or RNA helicase
MIANDIKKILEKNVLLKRALQIVNSNRSEDFYCYLKPKQSQCVRQCVEQHGDILGILATGAGKTLVFMVIPVYDLIYTQYSTGNSDLHASITLIISPLNAIINQQLKIFGKESAFALKQGNICFSIFLLIDE